MGLALLLAMCAALAHRTLPRWLAGLGLLSALLLLSLCLPALGIAVQTPIAAAAGVLSVWMLACGAHWSLRPAA
jgi:hypothetical protein